MLVDDVPDHFVSNIVALHGRAQGQLRPHAPSLSIASRADPGLTSRTHELGTENCLPAKMHDGAAPAMRRADSMLGGGGGGGERLIKDLKRKANSFSRDTRQANAVGLGGGAGLGSGIQSRMRPPTPVPCWGTALSSPTGWPGCVRPHMAITADGYLMRVGANRG